MQNQFVREQHIIPKLYFKRFADKKGFLKVLDIKKGKIIKPKYYTSVCYLKYFYGRITGKKDNISQLMEKFLKSIEDDFSDHYDGIVNDIIEYKKITQEQKERTIRFITNLWIRSEQMRDKINGMNRQIGKDLKDNAVHLSLIHKSYKDFVNEFNKKKWLIYMIKDKSQFITSDTPMIEMFERGTPFLYRIQLFVLTPKILIELIHPNRQSKEIKRKTIDNEMVKKFNFFRVKYSKAFCYSAEKEKLEDVLAFYLPTKEKNQAIRDFLKKDGL